MTNTDTNNCTGNKKCGCGYDICKTHGWCSQAHLNCPDTKNCRCGIDRSELIGCPIHSDSIAGDKSFFDMKNKDKKEVLEEAADGANKAQKALVGPVSGTEDWEKRFDEEIYIPHAVYCDTNDLGNCDCDYHENKREIKDFIKSERAKAKEAGYDKGFVEGFKDCQKAIQEGEHTNCCLLSPQIKQLADFLMKEYPEEITDGGAVDVAIKILSKLKEERTSL